MSGGTWLSKTSVAAQNRKRMTENARYCHKLNMVLVDLHSILPCFLARCNRVLWTPGSLRNGLFTETKSNLSGSAGKPVPVITLICCEWLSWYLTLDCRSASSPRRKESFCFNVFVGTDRAFFLLSAPANQSSPPSSLPWLLETTCLGMVSGGAWLSAAGAAKVWLPFREGLLSSKGEEGVVGDSAGVLDCLASPSRKFKSSLALRPSQSAELRCRDKAGVTGLGFLSGLEELRSSVENLMILGGKKKKI